VGTINNTKVSSPASKPRSRWISLYRKQTYWGEGGKEQKRGAERRGMGGTSTIGAERSRSIAGGKKRSRSSKGKTFNLPVSGRRRPRGKGERGTDEMQLLSEKAQGGRGRSISLDHRPSWTSLRVQVGGEE